MTPARAIVMAAALLLPRYVPASTVAGWSNLCAAIQERCEVSWYGRSVTTNELGAVATNDLYEVTPPVVTQPMVLHLGTVATNATDIFGGSVGPVVCETNAAAGVTNVWCWTNYVSLDTTWFVWTNLAEGRWEYPQLVATNFVLETPASLLAAWTNLAPTYAPDYPSAAAIAQMDAAILDSLAATYWIDTVAISNAGGLAVYLAGFTHTNHWWYDSDGDHTNDAWYYQSAHPLALPRLTVSNAWKYAGLEALADWTINPHATTQTVYGWEVGAAGLYQTNIVTEGPTTNYTWQYIFPLAPTLTAYRVELAQARIAASNAVVTNVAFGVTNTVTNVTLYVASSILGDRAGDVQDLTDAPWRGLTNQAARIEWTPAATNLPVPAGLALTISGAVVRLTETGLVRAMRAVEVAPPGAALTNAFRHVLSVLSAWTKSTTNGDPLVGSTMSIVWTNPVYSFRRGPGAVGLSMSNALDARRRVVDLMRWTATAHTNAADRWPASWSWSGWGEDTNGLANYTNLAAEACLDYVHSEQTCSGIYTSTTSWTSGCVLTNMLDCPFPGGWPWAQTFAFTNWSASPAAYVWGGSVWCLLSEHEGHSVGASEACESLADDYLYQLSEQRFTVSMSWPEWQTAELTNLTHRLAVDSDLVALFGDDDAGLALDPSVTWLSIPGYAYPRTSVVVRTAFDDGVIVAITNDAACDAGFVGGSITSRIVIASDLAGPATNRLAVWSTASKPAGSSSLSWDQVRFTTNAPSTDLLVEDTWGWDFTLSRVCTNLPTSTGTERRTFSRTDWYGDSPSRAPTRIQVLHRWSLRDP